LAQHNVLLIENHTTLFEQLFDFLIKCSTLNGSQPKLRYPWRVCPVTAALYLEGFQV
jgi:hypothetical protein